MNLRRYTIEVERTYRQTVTFVVDMSAVPNNDGLTKIAHGHAHPDKWVLTGEKPNSVTSEVIEP